MSQSKQVKEVLESLTMMRPTFLEELDPSNKKFYCKPFRRKQINGKWIQEDYLPDPTGVYRTIFFEKTRNGVSSNDTGVCMLWKFNGNNGTFVESAYCYPKHGKIC